MAKVVKKKTEDKAARRRTARSVHSGSVYIQSSFNNTLVTITDERGGVVSWSSAGSIGFKGTKKSTPYAAQLAANAALEKAKAVGLSRACVFVSGVGTGRESAVRALVNSNIEIISIKDITPIPHNGCRPKKPRRV
ncbi:MAG: 30S ribosomal protein S11 [Patescibacteria group bacterium]